MKGQHVGWDDKLTNSHTLTVGVHQAIGQAVVTLELKTLLARGLWDAYICTNTPVCVRPRLWYSHLKEKMSQS